MNTPALHATLPTSAALADAVQAVIATRQTVLPKRLVAPGPNAAQTNRILAAAAHAPDHGMRRPWRLVIVPKDMRPALGQAFADALRIRQPCATAEQLAQASEKAARSPLLLLAVVRLYEPRQATSSTPGAVDADATAVPTQERIASAGCALQNMLLMAHALGFGAALTSGQSLASAPLRALFGLPPHEQALCFLSIGSVARTKPLRQRPALHEYVSTLTAAHKI